MSRTLIVTHALPYANGPLHFGHILEATQTDIWVRFQRLRGHTCHFVCADDAHGTPIMIRAKAQNQTPEQMIGAVGAEHQRDLAGFLISYDRYHSTHSAENTELTCELYKRVRDAGYIARRAVRQAYDEQAKMFLPDRYVRGTCPRCKSADQYGDTCEVCGATYSPAELIVPRSTVSNTAPVWRESEHLFFQLGAFEGMLRDWLATSRMQSAITAKLAEWFETGLQDWDISRDAPYFGIEVPDSPGKYFYVWFDAPIGYLASFKALCKQRGMDFDRHLRADSDTELYHFIGKDIGYFHTLFWPAVLHAAGLRKPTGVFVHGFITINGNKMSKSRGTFITAERYLERLPPEPLRYYFATKLSDGVEDMDFSLDDFTARTNSDLVGKLVNIASRCAGFIERGGGQLADALPDPVLYAEFTAASEQIAALYESRQTSQAIREIMALADRANQYVDLNKPWVLAKDPANASAVRSVATQGVNLFRVLMGYLAPVLPSMAAAAGRFLNAEFSAWNSTLTPLLGSALNRYVPLATRLDPAKVADLVEAPAAVVDVPSALVASPVPGATGVAAVKTVAPPPSSINIADFQKIDIRIARVAAAATVEGSDKLVRLTLELGDSQRQVFSGIRKAYPPEQLVGRHVLLVANLEPRKMRFGVSEGMVLCAGDESTGLFLLAPDSGATAGMKVS